MAKIELDTDAGTVVIDGVNFVPEAAATTGDPVAGEAPVADESVPEGALTDVGDAGGEAAAATSTAGTGDAAAATTGDPVAGDGVQAGDEPAPVAEPAAAQT